MTLKAKQASFAACRINPTTFAITEDDKFGERPVIYAKLHHLAPVLILSDTGCDAPSERSADAKYIHLRDFLEQCPVPDNNDQPLNVNGTRSYIVICTHCHFDHICGIEQFVSSDPAPAAIVASKRGQEFITHDLPTHSLCRFQDKPTPEYEVICWAADDTHLMWHPDGRVTAQQDDALGLHQGNGGISLGITIFNTPGHTPDELAWYDEYARHLYVGDSYYKLGGDQHDVYGGPIIFPSEGSWIDYMASMRTLLTKVNKLNSVVGGTLPAVKVGCGHTTTEDDAQSTLESLIKFFEDVIAGHVPVLKSEQVRGEKNNLWHMHGSDWAVFGPERLCEEVRAHTS